MKHLKEIPDGQEYALISLKMSGEIFPLFAGEAGDITDDFMLAGVLISTLTRGEPVGLHVNTGQDPNFLAKVKAIK